MNLSDLLIYGDIFGGGGSGGSSGGVTVVNVPMSASAAIETYPYYDLSDSLGVVLVRVAEYAPDATELEGGLIFVSSNSITNEHDKYTLSADKGTITVDPDIGVVEVAGDVMSINKSSASALSAALGIEILPGLYFTDNTLNYPGGACLIYGKTT